MGPQISTNRDIFPEKWDASAQQKQLHNSDRYVALPLRSWAMKPYKHMK